MIVREGREQELVRAFFKGARSGFFVEVGANRPRQESQTWHLEQLGWNGVLIEPQPNLADDLGRAVSTTTAPSFKKVHLEMGGKNVIMIMDDAQLELAVEGVDGFSISSSRSPTLRKTCAATAPPT